MILLSARQKVYPDAWGLTMTDIIMCGCCGRSVFADDGVIKPHGPGREGEPLCPWSGRVIDALKPKPEAAKDAP